MKTSALFLLVLILGAAGCSTPVPPPQEPTPIVPVVKAGGNLNNNLSTKVLVVASTMNTVAMLDVETLAVEAVTVGKDPVSLDVTPDGRTAYVANAASDYVSRLSLPSLNVTEINAGLGPTSIAVTPDGRYAVVRNSDNSVAFISTTTGAVTMLRTQSATAGFAISPDSSSVWVLDNYPPALERISQPALTHDITPIPCSHASSIAMSDDASVIVVGCTLPRSIVLYTITDSTVLTLPESFTPTAVQFFHNSRYVAALSRYPGFVFILHTVPPWDNWFVNAGADSMAFSINSTNTALAVANNDSDDLTYYTIGDLSNSGFQETDIPLTRGPIATVFVDNDKYVVVTEGTPMGGVSIVDTSDLSVRNVDFIGVQGILNR